jgi:hypothetical protein
MKSILDRSFRYTPSYATDVKATFARIRREQRAAAPALSNSNVARLPERAAAKASVQR